MAISSNLGFSSGAYDVLDAAQRQLDALRRRSWAGWTRREPHRRTRRHRRRRRPPRTPPPGAAVRTTGAPESPPESPDPPLPPLPPPVAATAVPPLSVARLVAPARGFADRGPGTGGAGRDGGRGVLAVGPVRVVALPPPPPEVTTQMTSSASSATMDSSNGPPSPVDGGGKRPDRIAQRSHAQTLREIGGFARPHPPPYAATFPDHHPGTSASGG